MLLWFRKLALTNFALGLTEFTVILGTLAAIALVNGDFDAYLRSALIDIVLIAALLVVLKLLSKTLAEERKKKKRSSSRREP